MLSVLILITYRIKTLKKGIDYTNEVAAEQLAKADVNYTTDERKLQDADFIIVAVPTPINESKQPDLTALMKASETVGEIYKKELLLFMNQLYTQEQQKKYVFPF